MQTTQNAGPIFKDLYKGLRKKPKKKKPRRKIYAKA